MELIKSIIIFFPKLIKDMDAWQPNFSDISILEFLV